MADYCSPHRDNDILQLTSPVALRTLSPRLSIAKIRRSLSRSPSKNGAFRFVTSKSASPRPSSPLCKTPLILLPPTVYRDVDSDRSTASPSPTKGLGIGGVDMDSGRKDENGGMPATPSTELKSNTKRALRETTGNARFVPQLTPATSEASQLQSGSPAIAKTSLFNPQADENSQPTPFLSKTSKLRIPHQSRPLFGSPTTHLPILTAKSSPLKRIERHPSDMSTLESPSAKRRSIIKAPEFGFFESTYPSGSSSDSLLASKARFQSNLSFSETFASPGSVHNSEHEREDAATSSSQPISLQTRATELLEQEDTPSNRRGPFRSSAGSVWPHVNHQSPFVNDSPLPNASIHPLPNARPARAGPSLAGLSRRHPLSRTITQSSSSSSVFAEDSPTHVPLRPTGRRRPSFDFNRPLLIETRETQTVPLKPESTTASFSTPENYKAARPHPAAFMSTGLISKRNKVLDDEVADFRASLGHMPDTPCKRPSVIMAAPPNNPPNDLKASRNSRPSIHSFGTPSTPGFGLLSRPTLANVRKGQSIFGSDAPALVQRVSFADPGTPTHAPLALQLNTSIDTSIGSDGRPQTPTIASNASSWQGLSSNESFQGIQANLEVDDADSNTDGTKSTPTLGSMGGDDSDDPMDDSPSVQSRFRHAASSKPYSTWAHPGRPRERVGRPRGSSCSVPVIPDPMSQSLGEGLVVGFSPETPKDGLAPPDASGLSISVHNEHLLPPAVNELSRRSLFPPPSTPTSNTFRLTRSSITPQHQAPVAEIDPSLTQRFDRVELIGAGEFSQVYRVVERDDVEMSHEDITVEDSFASFTSTSQAKVYAVKRARKPYQGFRDRQRKLQEVEILKAVGSHEHVLQYVDSWENKDHLFIQTEYCADGSLDKFLAKVGRRARLDDFRIWKVLLELSSGLKHIHDSKFIHLDLKPANILIIGNGGLKIADFGMATTSPAPSGTDGEGDREYIAPEILKGQLSQAADVFALGLIMLEISANVMLPDNGIAWQRLRTGDLSDVPSLVELDGEVSSEDLLSEVGPADSLDDTQVSFDFDAPMVSLNHDTRQRTSTTASDEDKAYLSAPPDFMASDAHPASLLNTIRAMISPAARDRPTAGDVANGMGLLWIEERRRAGATVFEGRWGPDDIQEHEMEMDL